MTLYRISNPTPRAVTVRVGDVDMVIPPHNGWEVNTTKTVSVKPTDKVTVQLVDWQGRVLRAIPSS